MDRVCLRMLLVALLGVVLCLSWASVPASAQMEFGGAILTIQASQVAATVNGTTTRATTSNLGSYHALDCLLNITAGGAATGQLNLFVQDSPDGGTTWDDVWASNNFTFGAALTTQRFFINGLVATNATQSSAVKTEALAAGTVRDGPFGERLRVREVITLIAGGPTGPTYTIVCIGKI